MKTRYITAIAAAALVLSGCNRDEIVPGASSDGYLKLEVAGVQTVTAVKGTLINNEGQMHGAGVDNFMVAAWNNNTDCTGFVSLQEATYEDSKWSLTPSVQWTGEDTKTFFAYANLPTGATVDNTFTSDDKSQKLAITSLQTDARQQNDIMLGYYSGDGKVDGKDAHTAQIQFYHPLTAVKICDGGIFVDAINKITLSGIYASGTVDVTYKLGVDDKIAPEYVWGTTRTSYTSATLEPKSGDKLEIDPVTKVIGVPFVVIPQDVVAGKVRITLDVTVNVNESKTLAVDVPATTWTAGHTKSYTLSYGSETGYALTITEWNSETYPVELKEELPDLLPGKFSVSATKYVRFSKGNLQFKAGDGSKASPEWRFAEHQYDYIGAVAGNTTAAASRATQSAWIDLFGWGATGRTDIKSYLAQPYESDKDNSKYKTKADAAANETLTRENGGDWGVCMGDGWRTLSTVEWQYLFGNSAERKDKYKLNVTVCGIAKCLIIVPDVLDGYTFDNSKTEYTAEEWATAEAAGLVCLPPAGYRDGLTVNLGFGDYWSSSTSSNTCASREYFTTTAVQDEHTTFARHYGASVRLVQDVPHPSVKIGNLYWATENLAITASGKREWKGKNAGYPTGHVVGDFFQWGAYSDYLGTNTGYLVYDSFKCKACGDSEDSFAFKSGKGFNITNAPYYDGTKYTSYITSGVNLALSADIVRNLMGGSWRMPTQEDFVSMYNATTWTWNENDQGYYVTWKGEALNGNKSNALLFFPASGAGGDKTFNDSGTVGRYWSKTVKDSENAYRLLLQPGSVDPSSNLGKMNGFSIRPVKDAD